MKTAMLFHTILVVLATMAFMRDNVAGGILLAIPALVTYFIVLGYFDIEKAKSDEYFYRLYYKKMGE